MALHKDVDKTASHIVSALFPESFIEDHPNLIGDVSSKENDLGLNNILTDYYKGLKHSFGPLVPGGTPAIESAYRFQEKPLTTVLQVAPMKAALNYGTGVKAKSTLGTAPVDSPASQKAQKRLGVEPSDAKSLEDVAAEPRAFVNMEGQVFTPKRQEIADSKNVYHTYPVSENPGTRRRQSFMESVYKAAPDVTGLRYFRPETRGTRKSESYFTSTGRRQFTKTEAELAGVIGQVDKFERRKLVHDVQGLNTASRLNAAIIKDLATIGAIMRERKFTPRQRKKIDKAIKGGEIEGRIDKSPTRRNPDSEAEANKQLRDDMIQYADVIRLTDRVEFFRKMRDSLGKESKEYAEARKALMAASEIAEEKSIQAAMRKGASEKAAHARLQKVKETALRESGLSPKKGEQLAIISHVSPQSRHKMQRGTSFSGGIVEKVYADSRLRKGTNWKYARYVPDDPLIVLDSIKNRTVNRMKHERLMRALTLGEKYRPGVHQALLYDQDTNPRGPLKLITKDDDLVRDIIDVENMLDELEDLNPNITTEAGLSQVRFAEKRLVEMLIEHEEGVVVPKGAYMEMVNTYGPFAKMANKMTDTLNKSVAYQRVMGSWRHLVLSLKGSFYENNFFGNSLLGLLEHGPLFMAEVAKESKKDAGEVSQKLREAVPDLSRSRASSAMLNDRPKLGADGKAFLVNDIIDMAGDAVVKPLSRWTEDNFRYAALKKNTEKHIDNLQVINNKMVEAGVPGAKKMSDTDMLNVILNDRAAVEMLARKTYDDMLDYSKLSKFERDYMLLIYPFWNFTRSITGKSAKLYMDEPWKIQVAMMMDDAADIDIEEKVGSVVPDYLKRGLAFSFMGDTYATKASVNPFFSTTDLLTQFYVMAMNPDELPEGVQTQASYAQMNPLIKFGLGVLTKQDPWSGELMTDEYGQELSTGAATVRTLEGVLPPYQLYQKLKDPSEYSPYDRSRAEMVADYILGPPVARLDEENLPKLAQFEYMRLMREAQAIATAAKYNPDTTSKAEAKRRYDAKVAQAQAIIDRQKELQG